MSGDRFTAWLSADERKALDERAAECQCSNNAILRVALRAFLLDKPVPRWAQKETTGATK